MIRETLVAIPETLSIIVMVVEPATLEEEMVVEPAALEEDAGEEAVEVEADVVEAVAVVAMVAV